MKSLSTACAELLRQKNTLIQVWIQQVRLDVPTAKDHAKLALEDVVPDFIDDLANALGDASVTSSEHALQIAGLDGYTLRQVLKEHHALRRVVTSALLPFLDSDTQALCTINDAVDNGLNDAVQARKAMSERESTRHDITAHEHFIAAISHDLRNPVGSAKMAIDMLIAEHNGSEEDQELYGIISRSLDRAAELLTDLLDINLVKAGQKLPIDCSPMDMAQLLQQTLRTNNFENLSLVLDTLPVCRGIWSASALRRMLDNLVSNALKYGDKDRPITIRMRQDESSTRVSIHNFGNPIPPSEQATIFNPFVRSTIATADRHKEGWGLGLALIQAVAEAHGGNVAVTSSVTEGTKFTATLPNDASPFQRRV